jgi:IS30 family transposase
MGRNYSHFSKDERNELSILLEKGYSLRSIANILKRSPSSISREVKINSVNGKYDPKKANSKAKVKRAKSKWAGMKIKDYPDLEDFIADKLENHHWTPEQIAGRWNLEKHKDERGKIIKISAPSIYKFLYSSFGQYLCKFLPSCRYKKKRRVKKKTKKQLIPNRTPISKRPKKVEKRKEFGHFEGDTLGRIKSDTAAITGLVERISRFVLFVKVPRLKYAIEGFKDSLNPYEKILKSVTLDNGVENVRHQELQADTFFCNPYSSWEKGSIENSFGRLRRFIPRKSSLKQFSQDDILEFQELMNNTPRKCLDWKTPREVFNEHVSKSVIQTNQPGCCT